MPRLAIARVRGTGELVSVQETGRRVVVPNLVESLMRRATRVGQAAGSLLVLGVEERDGLWFEKPGEPRRFDARDLDPLNDEAQALIRAPGDGGEWSETSGVEATPGGLRRFRG